jgi:predicted nucleic acid-binding protein
MIAVDTNIVVRLLTQDDEQQYNKSLKVFQEQDIFIPDTVILETEWVLRFAYRFNPAEICQAFRNLFGLPNVQLTNGNAIAQFCSGMRMVWILLMRFTCYRASNVLQCIHSTIDS